MSFLMLPEQSGFIPQRSTAFNLRSLMSVLHRVDPQLPSVAVLLDAEKASTRFNGPLLEWSTMAQSGKNDFEIH